MPCSLALKNNTVYNVVLLVTLQELSLKLGQVSQAPQTHKNTNKGQLTSRVNNASDVKP